MALNVAVDIGGTFTDLIGYDEETGRVYQAKSSTTPADLVQGIMRCLEKSGLEIAGLVNFVHGSTVAINTVIEQKGAATALVVTEGTRRRLQDREGQPAPRLRYLFQAARTPGAAPLDPELRQDPAHRLEQRITGDRLRDEGAPRHHHLPVLCLLIGNEPGNEHDRDGFRLYILQEPLRYLRPIYLRHVDIKEDEVGPQGPGHGDPSQRLCGRDHRIPARFLEHRADKGAETFVVVDHEDLLFPRSVHKDCGPQGSSTF